MIALGAILSSTPPQLADGIRHAAARPADQLRRRFDSLGTHGKDRECVSLLLALATKEPDIDALVMQLTTGRQMQIRGILERARVKSERIADGVF